MKTLLFLSFAAIALIVLPLQAQPKADMIVSTDWLATHLDDSDLVILHVSNNRFAYQNGHIPGARFLWTGWFAQSNPDLTYELLPADKLEEAVANLGISNKSRVIICFSGSSVTIAARMFMTLEYLGLGNRTSFLDGGFETWKAEGRPVSTKDPSFAPAQFKAKIKQSAVTTVEGVLKAQKDPGTCIIDARSPRFYDGAPAGTPRGGHIPGAVNIPYSSVVDSANKFLSFETLKDMFEKAGVKEDQKVITYCHIGQQASLLYFIARYLGHEASVYDGSFEEWSYRQDLPVATKEQ